MSISSPPPFETGLLEIRRVRISSGRSLGSKMKKTSSQKPKRKVGLPPSIENIIDGSVTWKSRLNRDYKLLGYFLSCHLVIENYLDEVLKIEHPDLNWDEARIPFASRLALLEKRDFPKGYNFLPAVKYMNSLRNKISHQPDYEITVESLKPLADFLKQLPHEDKTRRKLQIPKTATGILDMFTSMCCVFCAGTIAAIARYKKLTRT